MKAISIDSEYIEQIMFGEKTEEYRSWPTKYRGDILLCTTKEGYYPGFAAVVVNLTDCVKCDDGGYAFKLENVRAIKPFEVKGQQRIYNIDVDPSSFEIYGENDIDRYEQDWEDICSKHDRLHRGA
jgi:hypothetical protein